MKADVADLISRMVASDWRDRREVMHSLQLGTPGVVEELVTLVREHTHDLEAFNAALQALAGSEVSLLESLLRLVRDAHPEVRTAGALLLGLTGDVQSTPLLIELLHDPDTNVRYHAIEALGVLRATEAAEELLELARDPSAFLAFAAIEALGRTGDATLVPDLIERTADAFLAGASVPALGRLGGMEAVETITRWMISGEGEVSPAVLALSEIDRRQAALGRFGSVMEVVRSLVRLEDRARIVAAGLDELEALPPAITGVPSPHPFPAALARVLGWLLLLPGERAPASDTQILAVLFRLLEDTEARDAAAEALARAREASLPGLLQRLSDDSPDTRRAAVHALGVMGDVGAVPPLEHALEAESIEVVSDSARALATIGEPSALEALLAHFGHPSAIVRVSVVRASLALVSPALLVPRILSMVGSKDAGIRESSILLLRLSGDIRALQAIVEATRDVESRVRREAVGGLRLFLHADAAVTEALRDVVRDPSPTVRAEAARVLTAAPEPDAVPLLLGLVRDEDPWPRYHACRSLARHQHVDTALLVELSEDPVPFVRAALADLAGATVSPTGRDLLERLLQDPSRDIRLAAAQAIGQGRYPDLVPALWKSVEDDDDAVRVAAISALGAYPAVDSVEVLHAMVYPRATRLAALESLARQEGLKAVTTLVEMLEGSFLLDDLAPVLAAQEERVLAVLPHTVPHLSARARSRLAAVLGIVRRRPTENAVDVRRSLRELLGDPSPLVRRSAVLALHDAPEAREWLQAVRQQDEDAGIRAVAGRAVR